ncbi:MAG: NADH-quinone oxidoreductase subunit L [Euzebyales bacterium]|nr:NADH-quinone oxidoreductase subunit L [Euzebyales bacterium]
MSSSAWLIPLLPALSAAFIFAFGRRMPRGGAEVGIAAIAVAFALSVGVAVEVFSANVDAVAHVPHAEEEARAGAAQLAALAVPGRLSAAVAEPEEETVEIPEDVSSFLNERSVQLARFGGRSGFEAGMRIDGLATMMFLLVTAVSLMVQVYSTGYMHGDPRYTYFFGLLSLFTASMLLLVIGNNLMMLLMGWELVGICSYLLIGFWWEEKTNSDAAIKAFLTTKLGDVGLMVGVITLWAMFGTFNISDIITAVGEGVQAGGAPLEQGLLTFALVCLFIGAIGKSAQFPLHTWLPDAMAGPTPVSALIHAATMVTAGIFLVARLYPVFAASETAMTVVAVIGTITLVAAGLLALVQDDIKRVLAYSTVSQLGYMIAALAFSYTAGIFHLFTHGFFKALLFLGAGSLIHAVHSNNMSDMGGLKRFMPVTFWTFLVGSAALAAVPPLAGFWSKDEVLAGGLEAGGYTGWLLVVLGALGGMVTAFYMTRVLWLVFAGEFRGHGHPHESPPAMKWPLVALAVPAALIGFANLPFGRLHSIGFAAWTMFDLRYFTDHEAGFFVPLAVASTLLTLAGFGLGTLLYRRVPEREPMLGLGLFSKVLVDKYYLDRLYTDAIVRTGVRTKLANAAYWLNDHVIDRFVYLAGSGTARLGEGTYTYADQRGIDGTVNGLAGGAGFLGREVFRKFQSGNVQLYAGGMFAGVFLLAVLFAFAA